MNIVLTREAGKNDDAMAWLPGNANVLEVPLTTTNYFAIDEVTRQLQASPDYGKFCVLVVTSSRTADYIHAVLGAMAGDADLLTVGTSTTRALRDHGVTISAEATSSALELEGVITQGPVLMVGAVVLREELSNELRARDISVTKVACYETLPVELDEEQENTLRVADVVFIGAPSAWSAARALVSEDAWVVVPGPTTRQVVAEDHERVLVGWGPSMGDSLASLYL